MPLLFLILLLFASTASQAQPQSDNSSQFVQLLTSTMRGQALEGTENVNLDWRGQGLAPWCFAFAEEQVIKDELCNGDDCQFNADQWFVSIFDIARYHEEASYDQDEYSNLTRTQRLFSGSTLSFPYATEQATTLRASRCTLEKEVFKMNRFLGAIGYFSGMYEMLEEMYDSSTDDVDDSPEAKITELEALLVSPYLDEESRPDLEKALTLYQKLADFLRQPDIAATHATLKEIANQASSAEEFIELVLDYSKCDAQVVLPEKELAEETVTSPQSVEVLLSELVQDRSVLIGICAEEWRTDLSEEEKAEGCQGHAVTVKDQNATHFLIVDSAFTPDNIEMNPDGSFWLEKSLVGLATAKMGRILETAKDTIEESYEQAMRELENVYASETYDQEFRDSMAPTVDGMIAMIKSVAQLVPQDKLKETVISMINQYTDFQPPAEDSGEVMSAEEIESSKAVAAQVRAHVVGAIAGLEFNEVDDIDQIQPILLDAYVTSMKQVFSASSDGFIEELRKKTATGFNLGHNVVWFK